MLIEDLVKVVEELKSRFDDFGYQTKHIVESKIKRSFTIEAQSPALYYPIIGYCVSTLDPLSLNRVRVYHPLLSKPNAKISQLPFARTCANQGGHDDCGSCWVPPAGTSVVIVCENGDRFSPIVLGTVWQMNRGPQASKFPYPIDEFYSLWKSEGYRGLGYLVGKKDGSQAYPPWDIENSNINNFDNEQEIDNSPDAQQQITYPNIYGWKTPGKHYIKMVDGDYRCNNRWARFEIMSKTGHWFIMKDDWFHASGEWANPKGICANSGDNDNSDCNNVSALLTLDIAGNIQNGQLIGEQGAGVGSTIVGGVTGKCDPSPTPPVRCGNPHSKRIEECRPYQGSSLPMKNMCELPQAGIHQQSVSGHQAVMDDAVNQPKEDKINWQHVYNTGCDDTLKCKYYFKSATGHMILMDDTEDISQFRGVRNGIRLQSAAGNYFYLKDHTLSGNIAGPERGLEFGTTSGHVFEMNDNENEQAPPIRMGLINKDSLQRRADLDPQPTPKAKNAYVQLRTGYGLLMRFDDSTSQQDTKKQFIMLAAAPKNGGATSAQDIINTLTQKTPSECKNQPHVLLMQLDEAGGGFVELSSGGKFVLASRSDSMEMVGTDNCPANKETAVFGNYLISAKQILVNKCSTQINIADKYIILGAGQDCPINQDNANQQAQNSSNATGAAATQATQSGQEQQTAGPCIFPLIIAKDPIPCPIFPHIIHWTKWSDRVFASSSK